MKREREEKRRDEGGDKGKGKSKWGDRMKRRGEGRRWEKKGKRREGRGKGLDG